MLQNKLKELGFKFSDKYLSGASYLFPDGTFLNIDEQDLIQKHAGKWFCHSMLDAYIHKHLGKEFIIPSKTFILNPKINKYISDTNDRILRYTDNAIVLNDGKKFSLDNCYLSLPPEKLSNKQLDALTLYIDNLYYNSKDYLHYNSKKPLYVDLDEDFREFNLDEDSTDDIIKEIKRMYAIRKARTDQ